MLPKWMKSDESQKVSILKHLNSELESAIEMWGITHFLSKIPLPYMSKNIEMVFALKGSGLKRMCLFFAFRLLWFVTGLQLVGRPRSASKSSSLME